MTNRKLLEKAIQESGLKKSHIAQALGMSRPTFNAYMAGAQEFRVTHMNLLCALLKIDPEQREAIFFDQSGAL
jgi:transcriptional regulator with XRE-family HTH domain